MMSKLLKSLKLFILLGLSSTLLGCSDGPVAPEVVSMLADFERDFDVTVEVEFIKFDDEELRKAAERAGISDINGLSQKDQGKGVRIYLAEYLRDTRTELQKLNLKAVLYHELGHGYLRMGHAVVKLIEKDCPASIMYHITPRNLCLLYHGWDYYVEEMKNRANAIWYKPDTWSLSSVEEEESTCIHDHKEE